MKRRDFLKAVTAGIIWGTYPSEALPELAESSSSIPQRNYDDYIKDYLHRMRNFDKNHKGDVCLDKKQFLILRSSMNRLTRLQGIVGHANFHLLDFDYALRIARNYNRVGRFNRDELDFIEMIFHRDAALYGFFGEKSLESLTSRMKKQEMVKIPSTGNYLYNGQPFETYKKIKKIAGDKVVLTSGVRSILKQFQLFLNKVYKSNGNLSLASRSLAPPGYSFHGIGDFDVGQAGFGAANFTERFISTEVYSKLQDSDYLTLRYPQDNRTGVRFEPWHIRVS